ncbi:MAG: hypothetical protein A2Y40_04500 [Candidatus Margulisbacteria bacterium GWF2_35_9]|nr:MAG: hypothetical protein A2Y40_04500 [Candidatus Margulisbacteria bacterium GWF2_35_9]
MFILFEIWGIDIYKPLQSNIYIVIKILQILFLLLVGFLALQGSKFIIHKLKEEAVNRMGKFRKVSKGETEKRATTLASLSQKTINIAIFVIISMMILTALGIDIKPILGGVGILGLAVGFGAQNLVRDIISGLFLIFEDQIRVGDVAIINGTGGLVEQVNLRITVLRGLDGTVHIFPNGMITTLSNMTHDYSFYLMDIGVAYKENVDNVIEVIKQLGTEMEADENYGKFILEPMEILGLDKFADSAIIIKARIKTVPIQQWFIGREFNRRMKNRFDELGIEIPFPHMTFYFGDASKPVKVENNTQNLDEKKLMELLEKISKEKKKS